MDIETIFEFICGNPPMALIGGGILSLLTGALLIPFSTQSSEVLLSAAPWLLGGGVLLQILWLFRGTLDDLLKDILTR